MSEFRFDGSDMLSLEATGLPYSLKPEELSSDEIKDSNNAQIKGRDRRRYIQHTHHQVQTQTFVIPVSDGGTITAYYFVSQKQAEVKGSMPLTIFFHGGGWLHGNMDYYSYYLKYYAYTMQSAVLLVDYRLAPAYRFPTAIEDCYDALLWALDGTKYWKIDPDRIFVAGDGFGATLAATVAILLRDRKGATLSGQILIYPLADCRLRTQSMETYKETPVLTQKMLGWYIKNYSREPKDMLSPMMSPLLYPDLSRLPDTLVIGAEIDPLSDDAKLYGEALKKAGTKAKVLIAEGAMHGFLTLKKGKGRRETETAIWQMTNGRNVDNIEFLEPVDFKKFKKSHG